MNTATKDHYDTTIVGFHIRLYPPKRNILPTTKELYWEITLSTTHSEMRKPQTNYTNAKKYKIIPKRFVSTL